MESKSTSLPQSIPLEAFIRNQFGAKHLDQAGGFVWWARRNGHRTHSTTEWRNLLDQFNNRPVGAR